MSRNTIMLPQKTSSREIRSLSHPQHRRTASAKPSRKGGKATSVKWEDGADESGGCQESSDEEDHENDQDDEAEVFAPSGPAAKKARCQTGLQPGDTTSQIAQTNRKRRYSTSSADEEVSRRNRRSGKAIKSKAADYSDDDYNAIDFISESDEEEPTMEKFEERIIINSEEDNSTRPGSPVFPNYHSSMSSDGWQGFELDDSLFPSDVPFFDAQIDQIEPINLTNDNDLFNPTVLLNRSLFPSPPPSRRVHFVDDVQYSSDSAGSGTSNADRDVFPDLFMHQDNLDPSFRKLIEKDSDGDGHSLTDGEGSYWDLDENEDFELEKHGLDDDSSSNASYGSSGYETDMGETTDEEVIPPTTITRPQSLLRLNSSLSFREASTSTPAPTPIRKVGPKPGLRRRGPSMGSWIADPTKPIAVIDSSGKHMVIYPAQCNSVAAKTASNLLSSGSSSTTTTPKVSFASLAKAYDESDHEPSEFSRLEFGPMLGSSTNLMMPGLLHGGHGMDYLLGGQVLGPPEAFYPFRSIDMDGNVMTDEDENEDDNDDEDMWNVHDFIDFGDDSSSADEKDTNLGNATASTTAVGASKPTAVVAKPLSDTVTKSTGEGLLHHFDKGVVSAFRRNQHRHQALLCRPAARSAMYALHGVKGGRQAAANSPISPMRKRKTSHSLSKGGSPFSSIAAKRRGVITHKRSKSAF